MSINIKVQRTYNVNGKEYGSLEEMPPEIREAFEKTMSLRPEFGFQAQVSTTRTKIVFNGQEYVSPDAMPPDVRQLYDTVMKAAEPGADPSARDLARLGNSLAGQTGALETGRPAAIPPATRFESSFSARAVIASVLVGALVLLLYYFWNNR